MNAMLQTCLAESSANTRALQLLSVALDPNGHIAIVGLKAGTPAAQKFIEPGDFSGAVDQAMRFDRIGMNAYFGTSTLRDGTSRKAENVDRVKCFKLDLDVGTGDPKKYPSQRDAIIALDTFCGTTGLARPATIDSGYGVHVYWPLTEALDAEDGKIYSEKLKSICIAYGLKTDVTVTADVVRILRVPGTHNYKNPDAPKPVRLRGSITVHCTDMMLDLIDQLYAAYAKSCHAPALFNSGMSVIPEHLKNVPIDDATKTLAQSAPKQFSIILRRSLDGTGCAQVRDVYNNRATMDEPRWRAGLSIAHFCADAADAIHVLSEAHPEYNHNITVHKAEGIIGPYTCATFQSNWPEHCKGCPHQGIISSPIQLGIEGTTANTGIWAQPEPLPNHLLPVAPFDMTLLPDVLRPWVNDIVDRMQCPADFVGVTVMSALGTLIGRRVGIRPKQFDDWTEYCKFWTCIVGRPGVMKSPAMAAALAPLNALGANASRKYSEERAAFDAEAQLRAMRNDAQKKNIAKTLAKNPDAAVQIDVIHEPETPRLKRYLVNDATVESLLDICIENSQGVCAYRDELIALLKNLEREGQEGARGFYLSGWNGNSGYTADRIGRGRNMHAEAICLSVLGSTQPGRISEYLRAATSGGVADDGLIQRFGLLIWPDHGGGWRNVDRWPDSKAKNAAFELFENLDATDPVTDWKAERVIGHDGNPVEGEPPYLRLDDDAAKTFLQWRTAFEQELHAGDLPQALESHFSKYRKLVPSMALVCHLADAGIGPVSNTAMLRALAWVSYLRSHAERAYSAVTQADIGSAKTLLKRIRCGDVLDGFAARDIYRKQWTGLSTRDEVIRALTVLIDYGWLRSVEQQTDGRTKTVYHINPNTLDDRESNPMITT